MYHLSYTISSSAMGAHAALEEIGAPYALDYVDLEVPRSPEYLRLNPQGKVPVLIDESDPAAPQVIYQSAAILLHLADKHPEAALAPVPGSAARGLCYQWLFFMAEVLQPAYMLHFYPERFTAQPDQTAGVEANATELIAGAWAMLDDALDPGPYLLGEAFSVCDLYMHTMALWNQPHHRPLSEFANVARALALVHARPAVQRMLAVHNPDVAVKWV